MMRLDPHLLQPMRGMQRLSFYVRHYVSYWLPDVFYRWRREVRMEQLSAVEREEADRRAQYYCRLEDQTELPADAMRVGEHRYPWRAKKKWAIYYFDLHDVLRHFPTQLRFCHTFGDVNWVPEVPTFVKSRPIAPDAGNANGVLLRLNSVRHYSFVPDNRPWREKKDMLVMRNEVHQEHRRRFLALYSHHPLCDAGQINPDDQHPDWQKPYLLRSEQLEYRYIACLEGNDVATNLKWVMASNSIAVMPRPRFETWFMEGTLIPDYHYICIADDFSDLPERLAYYSAHPEEAEAMLQHAHDYVQQFQNPRVERAVALRVAKRYFQCVY